MMPTGGGSITTGGIATTVVGRTVDGDTAAGDTAAGGTVADGTVARDTNQSVRTSVRGVPCDDRGVAEGAQDHNKRGTPQGAGSKGPAFLIPGRAARRRFSLGHPSRA